MISKILQYTNSTSEKDLVYDGILSTTSEWHGLTIGLYIGLYMEKPHKFIQYLIFNQNLNQNTHLSDSKKELVYTITGIMLAKIYKYYKNN